MKEIKLAHCHICQQSPLVDKDVVFCANPRCWNTLPIKGRAKWNKIEKMMEKDFIMSGYRESCPNRLQWIQGKAEFKLDKLRNFL